MILIIIKISCFILYSYKLLDFLFFKLANDLTVIMAMFVLNQ